MPLYLTAKNPDLG